VRSLALLILALPGAAHAGPKEWFDDGVRVCQESVAAGAAFDCTICGVPVSCNGSSCSFGSLSAPVESAADQRLMLERGFSLYCMGSGGSILNIASASGVQLQTLGAIFRAAKQGGPVQVRSTGGVVEVKSSVVGTSGGFAIPGSWTFKLGARANLDLMGNLVVGLGDVKQFGFNLNPTYARILRGHREGQATKVMVTASLPFQLIGVFGGDLDSSASWGIGAGGGIGVARRHGKLTWGAGATLDLRYAAGAFLPTTLAGTISYDVHRLITLAGQLGLSFEPLAGASAGDTIKPTLLLGLEYGKWILGYQGFFQPGAISGGIAVAYVGGAGAIAREAAGIEVEPRPEPPKPEPPKPPPPKPAPPKPTPATRPASQPATQPASQPATQPASQPATPATQRAPVADEPGAP
jgi:hypothetical protein